MVARTLESTNKNDRPVVYTVLEMLLTYQDEGMTARARGLGFDTNPFLVRERMPQTTGVAGSKPVAAVIDLTPISTAVNARRASPSQISHKIATASSVSVTFQRPKPRT